MPYHRMREHAFHDQLRAIGRQLSELADSVRDAMDGRSGNGHAMARRAGRQLVRLGDDARHTVRRHPAATGVTVVAALGVAALVAAALLRNGR